MRFRRRVSAFAIVLAALLAPLAAIAKESVKVQATQRSFNDAYRQEDWERAIDLGHELVTMLPNRPLVQYNLACVYALSGDGDSALHGFGDHAENYPRLWGTTAAGVGAILAVPFGTRRVGDGRGWEGVDEADAILELTLEQVKDRFRVDEERIVLTGFSQGGFLALALGVRHRDLFAGVIPMACAYIPEIDAPPVARKEDPRYYFIVGAQDRALPDTKRAARDFKAAGYDVKLQVVPGIGHAFPADHGRKLRTALRWVLDR